MDPIVEALEEANESSSDDFGFKLALQTLKRQIDGEIANELFYNIELLESTDAEHPLLDALRGYQIWANEKDYENGAERALKKYEEGIEQTLDEEWFYVASWSLAIYIELADAVNHTDRLQRGVEEAIELLEAQYSDFDTDEGSAGRILDAISEVDLRPVDAEVLDRLVDFCWSRVDYTNKQDNYHAERNYLRRRRRIQEQRGESVDDVHDGLIESYEDEIEHQRTRSHLATATTIEEAINECRSFADDETLNQWRLEKREENRKGIQKEMKPIGGEVPEEVAENFSTMAQKLVENFEEVANEQSPEMAFIGLVKTSVLVPSIETEEPEPQQETAPEEGEGTFPTVKITDVFPRKHMTHEGDSVDESASDIDDPDWYTVAAQLSTRLTARVVYKVLNQELIREHHFYTLLESVDGATVDDKAFLTDFLIAFFESRHAEAIHLGMARLEGLMKHQLEAAGLAVTGDKQGGDLPKSFGGLMKRIDGVLDEEYVKYLRFRYHDFAGEALRNRIAHGNLRYKEAHFDLSASLLVEIFRTWVYINELE